ncbi:MAG: cupin domain-containing protein [Betaproteobacteria bacterium]|nr:cupin domain-containing protein [Betaproteobacteria bacterium]
MGNSRVLATSAAFVLALLITLPASSAEHVMTGHVSILPSELKWSDAPSVAPGAQIVVIEGDLKTAAPFTFRLKLPANSSIGVHTHPVVERVTVMSGTFYLGIGDKIDPAKARSYTPGGITIMPVGMPMFVFTKEETIVQIHGTGPWGINFLKPAD